MPTRKPFEPEVPANADDPGESQRFINTAREIGVDESPEAFDRLFKSVARPKRPKPSDSQPQ